MQKGRKRLWSKRLEKVVERLISAGGLLSIVLVALIFVFVVKEGLPMFKTTGFGEFFMGKRWQPSLPPPNGPWFGLLPNLWGSVLVTLGAAILAVPLGLTTALFIGEVAPKRLRTFFKGFVELLSVIPSVALGFIGAVVVNPLVKDVFNLDTGKSAIAGSLMLALIALPTIATIAEDGLAAVPRAYQDASLAVGATRWQGIRRVIVPAAIPSLIAAVMLGIGRAIGETMVVIMVTGNAGLLPDNGLWYAFTHSVRTITGTIGAEALEVANGEPHYHAIFMLAAVLFAITFIFNYIADIGLRRQRRRVAV